jgi:co-chaperonin GroES (HSP10)
VLLLRRTPARVALVIRVLLDHVLIEPEPPEIASKILWTPRVTEKKRSSTGVIVAIGEGMKVEGRGSVRYGRRVIPWKGPVDAEGYNRYPMPAVKVGDRVIYLTWAATLIAEENGVWVQVDELRYATHHIVRDTAIEAVFLKEAEAAE